MELAFWSGGLTTVVLAKKLIVNTIIEDPIQIILTSYGEIKLSHEKCRLLRYRGLKGEQLQGGCFEIGEKIGLWDSRILLRAILPLMLSYGEWDVSCVISIVKLMNVDI
ncbi:conserved hypothetical protein [Ricinus communis]|uniref:Uncharacterized protein n=1 Tax=Ricinus communis TaxID=3988 RepID=B9SRQ2_RICCO|nr:conserved hypothetical protein [Ricinus communis]